MPSNLETPSSFWSRAAPTLVAAAACAIALSGCGPSPVIVVQERPPPAEEPLKPPGDRQPLQIAGDAPEEEPARVAGPTNACDLEPRIAALGRQCVRLSGVSAVGTGADQAAVPAFDGDACTIWNSGGFAPQSATLDLGSPKFISAILLVPEMTPSRGLVHHTVEVSDDGRLFQRLGELKLTMRTGEAIELPVPNGVTTRFLRITTSESPSHVAWRDVAIIRCGRGPGR
jgi:hypothetical protein